MADPLHCWPGGSTLRGKSTKGAHLAKPLYPHPERSRKAHKEFKKLTHNARALWLSSDMAPPVQTTQEPEGSAEAVTAVPLHPPKLGDTIVVKASASGSG